MISNTSSPHLGVVMPFWLDRPDEEPIEIALAAEQAGIETIWIGELASFDAFALATAIGLRTRRARLKIGPLAVGVRSPVAIALGVASGPAIDTSRGTSRRRSRPQPRHARPRRQGADADRSGGGRRRSA